MRLCRESAQAGLGAEAAHPKAPGAVEAVLPQGLLSAG